MLRFVASSFALAAPTVLLVPVLLADADMDLEMFETADALQLLQVAATRHKQTDDSVSRDNGWCSTSGDVHMMASYYAKTADPQKFGLFNWASSKDGRLKSQMFQCPISNGNPAGWVNAMAYEVDGNKIVILPPLPEEQDPLSNPHTGPPVPPVKMRINDIMYSSDQIPFVIPGSTIDLRGHKRTSQSDTFLIYSADNAIRLKVQVQKFNGYAFMDNWVLVKPDNRPDPKTNEICTLGPAATPIADQTMESDWSLTMFTNADHDQICDFCLANNERFDAAHQVAVAKGLASNERMKKCAKPPPTPPIHPAKQTCEEKGCSWTHSQQLCHSLQEDEDLYKDCLFDFCMECEDAAATLFIDEEQDEHPLPTCAQGAVECQPADVCGSAVKMNTLSVTQNNLGGVGPDSGAEEIRYSNAAVVNGQKVDLVLTTDGTFTTGKPAKNGQSGAFGILNVKCGTSLTVNMRVVDSASGAPVTLDAVALTWYDLDEGKKQKGRASVTSCGSTGAIVSQNTELTTELEGDCQSFTSSVAGSGKDNPTSPHQLDSLQVARAVTLPFKGVSEFSTTLSLSKGHNARNFLFALEPTVACGNVELR